VHVLCGVCLDCDEIERLRHNIVHLFHFRLRRGQCVRGWERAASPVYLQCWLRVHVVHDSELLG
jgi:hypothetical protein